MGASFCKKLPLPRGRLTGALAWTSWCKRDEDTGCINWYGDINRNGYGTRRSLSTGRRRRVMIHRLAYEWRVGPIPEGLEVDHLCNNRRCCNPEHLEAVTRRENLRRSRIHRDASGQCLLFKP